MMRYGTFALSAALFSAFAQTAQQAPRRVLSPEVKPDKTVTFRFRSPSSNEVLLARGGQRIPMQKGEDGVWTVTTAPLAPDLYGYSFVADGVSLMDPVNPLIVPNLLNPQSMVHIPGDGLPWDVANVPHGTVQRRFYHSNIVGDDRDFYVYTPPGYDPIARKQYPVLYLLHGFSDDASGWTAVGQAHVILDNLIAQGKAQPMLIVMTLGYGALEILSADRSAAGYPALRQRSFSKFRDSLFEEVMPVVEKEYRVAKDRNMRAIAGLSMGGAETLFIGLNNLNRFAYIGAFSAGAVGDDQFQKLDGSTANSQLRLFWISCGVDDGLLDSNRKFVEFMKSKNVEVKLRETPGAHTWMVWRRNLAEFAPLLFQRKSS